jgi:hypothetical protein
MNPSISLLLLMVVIILLLLLMAVISPPVPLEGTGRRIDARACKY